MKTKAKQTVKTSVEIAERDDLPEGWECVPLCRLSEPSRPRRNPQDLPELPYIGMEQVEPHTRRLLGVLNSTEMKSTAFHFQPDDVLYGRLRPYLNKVWCAEFEGLCSSEFIVLPPSESFDSRYLTFFLNTDCFVEFANHLNQGDRPRVNFDQIESYPIPLPPLSEQRRIVSKLDEVLGAVASCRERLTKIPTLLKRFRQAVLANACSGKLTADWRMSANTDRWKNITLGEIINEKPRNGYSARPVRYETAFRVLTLSATTSGTFDERQYKYFDEKILPNSEFWLQPNDILIQRGNTTEYVGVPAIYKGTPNEFIYPDLMIRIRAGSKVLSDFLILALANETARNYLRERATGTAGNMPKINQDILVSLPLELPPLPEQREIVRRVESLFAFADKIESRLILATANVEKLTQSVLAKAFRGELVERQTEVTDKVFSEDAARRMVKRIELKKMSKPDKAACALFLDIVGRNPGISAQDHTKLWICGIAPQKCQAVLDKHDLKKFAPVLKQTIYKEPPGLWQKFRDLLEAAEYITVDRNDNTQRINPSSEFNRYPKELQMTSDLLRAEFAEKVMEILNREENSTTPSPTTHRTSDFVNVNSQHELSIVV